VVASRARALLAVDTWLRLAGSRDDNRTLSPHRSRRALDRVPRSRGRPPLVLLHGFLCDSRVWRRELETLSDQFKVVAWDAPGAGESSDPPDPFTIKDWAAALAAFLDALRIEHAHVLGLSWGGLLAQAFYRLQPRRCLTLILADTYAGWKGSLGPQVAEQRLVRCLRESSLPGDEFAARWVPHEFFADARPELADEMASVVSQFHPPGFRLMAKTLADNDTNDLLTTIDAPTLLLWGEKDQRSPIGVAKQFRSAIPSAELIVIPGAGHASNMEQPAAFDAHVRRFCLESIAE
jgi:pimeloyl-ACP methyl ester carboxylesterase